MISAAYGGVTRRLFQTLAIFLVPTAAAAAALLGLTLLANADELFYNAVANQHVADLAVTIDSSKSPPRSWLRPPGCPV